MGAESTCVYCCLCRFITINAIAITTLAMLLMLPSIWYFIMLLSISSRLTIPSCFHSLIWMVLQYAMQPISSEFSKLQIACQLCWFFRLRTCSELHEVGLSDQRLHTSLMLNCLQNETSCACHESCPWAWADKILITLLTKKSTILSHHVNMSTNGVLCNKWANVEFPGWASKKSCWDMRLCDA